MKAKLWSACFAFVVMGMAPGASAQEPKSAPLAKRLAAAMEAAKLDSLTVKDPSSPNGYVGVFHLAGAQLIVVSANYSVPSLLDARIARREFRDAYVDLNSASEVASRVLVEDAGANGLQPTVDASKQFDSASTAGKRLTFDSNWMTQQLSEADYLKAFAVADERYARMLTTLLRAAQDPSIRVAGR